MRSCENIAAALPASPYNISLDRLVIVDRRNSVRLTQPRSGEPGPSQRRGANGASFSISDSQGAPRAISIARLGGFWRHDISSLGRCSQQYQRPGRPPVTPYPNAPQAPQVTQKWRNALPSRSTRPRRKTQGWSKGGSPSGAKRSNQVAGASSAGSGGVPFIWRTAPPSYPTVAARSFSTSPHPTGDKLRVGSLQSGESPPSVVLVVLVVSVVLAGVSWDGG